MQSRETTIYAAFMKNNISSPVRSSSSFQRQETIEESEEKPETSHCLSSLKFTSHSRIMCILASYRRIHNLEARGGLCVSRSNFFAYFCFAPHYFSYKVSLSFRIELLCKLYRWIDRSTLCCFVVSIVFSLKFLLINFQYNIPCLDKIFHLSFRNWKDFVSLRYILKYLVWYLFPNSL